MSNINQWQFNELPNSKMIITDEVYYRLQKLIGRTAWIPSEHSTTLFGNEIENENAWLIDEVNENEDYINRGTNSLNAEDYSVSTGKKQSYEIIEKLQSGSKKVVIDIHTHPSGLIDDFRFISGGDVSSYIQYNSIISNIGGIFFSGLIGCDRVNGNMSFSIICFNKSQNTFYRIQDIYLRKRLPNGEYEDFLLPKYGKAQLIMQNWNVDNVIMNQESKDELKSFGHR